MTLPMVYNGSVAFPTLKIVGKTMLVVCCFFFFSPPGVQGTQNKKQHGKLLILAAWCIPHVSGDMSAEARVHSISRPSAR